MKYDVIVLGLGAMGASAVATLARRGAKVLGIDRFSFGHERGSTHGESRLTRLAYFEHPDYVPLLRKSHELWRALERESNRGIFSETGLLYFGGTSSAVLAGVRKSASLYGVAIENLSPQRVSHSFPSFSLPDSLQAIFESTAGFLRLDEAMAAFASIAEKNGASLIRDEAVLDWRANDGGYEVHTGRERFWAKGLVLALGPWNSTPLLKWSLPLLVRRQTQFWFGPKKTKTAPEFPCFAFDLDDAFIYGFPTIQGLVKMADHTKGDVLEDPNVVDRKTREGEALRVGEVIRQVLPWLDPEPVRSSVCLYTMTPDSNFVLDLHPDYPKVAVAAGFSGHGFKFAPVVGEIMADLALNGTTQYPISFLSGRRFGK